MLAHRNRRRTGARPCFRSRTPSRPCSSLRPRVVFRSSNDDTLVYQRSQFGATRVRWTMREPCHARSFLVLYAFLKAFHLLAVIVWIGGMAFMLFCLRPAARVLEPAPRVTLMHAAMRRFITVVAIAIAVIVVCGAAMI